MQNDYRLDIDKLIEDIRTFSLSVVVMSNRKLLTLFPLTRSPQPHRLVH